MIDHLIVRGAREHNLKNINLEMPRNALIVFTGLSGSGKSSLAFDTIFAEGQRRYVESLSAYARQFLGQMDKPDVDFIEGLSLRFPLIRSPQIAIRAPQWELSPRSMTIYAFSLLAQVGLIVQSAASQLRDRVPRTSLIKFSPFHLEPSFKF
ncbi:MAG: hypothetical protein RL125_711 [Actinomycetota bacterium]